jgi:excisionase family DNA binding protein
MGNTAVRNLFDSADNPRPVTAAERKSIAQAEYLTPAEAAILLRTSRKHIYALIADGTLPAIRLGQRFMRIRRADIDALRTAVRRHKAPRNAGNCD